MEKLKTSLITILVGIFLSSFSLLANAQEVEKGKQKTSKVVTLVWPGDFHLTTPTEKTALDIQKVILEANTVIKPDFIHLAGDNTDNGVEAEYQLLKNILDAAKMPVYPMVGDHDVKGGAQNWERYFGKAYYSFDFGGYHFATLNSMDGDADMSRVGFSKEQLKWLEFDLTDAESRHLPSLLFWHFYPPDKIGVSWQQMRQIITKHRVLGVLTGHAHFNQITNYGRYLFITTRTILSPMDSKNTGYAVLCLDNGALSWKFKELNQDFPFVLITYPANKILATNASAVVKGDSAVRAKAFSDQKIIQSRYRIDEGEWTPMSSLPDEGMWEAKFDSRNLKDGEHKLSVEVTDSKSRRATDEIVMIVNQQGEFVPSVARIPDIIPGAKKGRGGRGKPEERGRGKRGRGRGRPPVSGKPTILTRNGSELLLSIGSVWMMTANGLQGGEIRILSITPNAIYAATKKGLFQSSGGAIFSEVKRTKDEKAESFGEVTAVLPDKRGTIYVSTHRDGIFKSNDGGASWQEISSQLAANTDDFHVHSLVVDAKNRLYAATASGIFRTDDGGANWREAGLENLYIKTMAIDQNNRTIYAATKEHSGSGFGAVYRSTDGTTWEKIGGDIPKEEEIEAIFVSYGKIYALTKNGLYVSAGGDFSLEEDLSRSMGFLQETTGKTEEEGSEE